MNKLYEALEEVVAAERYYTLVYSGLEELENKVSKAREELETARAKFSALVSRTKEEIANK